ncbi:MAG TPA: ABC transporter ATP-binding protein [Streptosporangiaceae bacterium]|jgi:branched-chain amino acid transport system ATP-binding protein
MTIEVSRLSTGYERPFAAVDGVSFELDAGQILGVIGQNGAGKSTLVRCLSGMLPPWGGTVRCDGADLTTAPPRRRVAAGVATVPENRQVFGTLSVRDNLQVAALGTGIRLTRAVLAPVYERFPVLAERERLPASGLSGGEQQMLAIARVLIGSPRYILMDEPTLGLSPAAVHRLGDLIADIAADGIGVLLAEQNSSLIERLCSAAIVLREGRPGATLGQDDLRSEAVLAAAYFGTGAT